MSGGRLVVMDRAGRDVKRYLLGAGLATLGRDPACDIRVMQPHVDNHHATVVVHAAQTVVRNVGEGSTLVNGRPVSVAALRHGDVITVGDRALRWEYDQPRPAADTSPPRLVAAAGARRARGARGARRGSAGAPPVRPRDLQLALELHHRASMPGSTGGKQVAVVQPQRRDTNDQAGRASPQSAGSSEADRPRRRRSPAQTTKATLWIESRKAGPRPRPEGRCSAPARRGTPLRLAVLRKAQSARKLVKIEAPLTIDHTKQAAIMLMTGHTPRSKLSTSPQNKCNRKSPSYVVKKPSPVRKTPRARGTTGTNIGVTPSRGSSFAQDSSNRTTTRNSGNRSITILEISDSTRDSRARTSGASPRAGRSPPASPRKSAMKDLSRRSARKTESIKFDLSNLSPGAAASEDELTLRYSESSRSPSPRKSIHSRGSRMPEAAGTPLTPSPSRSLPPEAPRARASARGSAMLQRALGSSAATFPERRDRDLESYSVVDLVSFESSAASRSVYDSAGSMDTVDFGTPAGGSVRRTRSTIGPALVGSSTPYAGGARGSRSNVTLSGSTGSTRSTASTRRSKSISTPENRQISVTSTRISRASRSRSRINDSDLLLLDETEVEDSSPRTSKRSRTTKSSARDASGATGTAGSPRHQGGSTPENRSSPEAAGTPVLSIRSLLDSSRSSLASGGKGGASAGSRRKTIGALSEAKRRQDTKAESLGTSVRKTWLRLSRESGESSDRSEEGAPRPAAEELITPKSAVKISPEAVKNKHSTAKKPQSKRTIIDDLNRSDIVKQLFSSPVKRKLSRSMTEFSRKQLFDDEDDAVPARRPARNTVAATGGSPDHILMDRSGSITPERFVSSIDTSTGSGLGRSFRNTAAGNKSRGTRSGPCSPPAPRARDSIKAGSAGDRARDARAKGAVASPPSEEGRRGLGVKALFRRSPANDLTDVRGVKRIFRRSPENDLRNVSGVKRTLRNTTPRNDLTDVRGVRRVLRRGPHEGNYYDVSGVEELFDESARSLDRTESLFDMIAGRPPLRSVYSRTFSPRPARRPGPRRTRSLRRSVEVVPANVEEWLERELRVRLRRELEPSASSDSTVKELRSGPGSPGGRDELPLKKRSPERSRRRLPLKKRAVVHSTPVKGRAHLTMNGSELGRVSPIAASDDASDTRSTRIITDENPVKTRTPRKQETPKKIVISRPSPPEKRTPPKRATRNRKAASSTAATARKRRNSLVILKKAPGMSPRCDPESAVVSKKASPEASPRTTRASRRTKEERIETPKKTRARAAGATVVVTKPSPRLKPQPEEKVAKKSQTEVRVDKPSKTRRNAAVETEAESLKVSPKSTRRTRANAIEKEPKTGVRMTKLQKSADDGKKVEKPSKTKRERRNIETEQPVPPRRGRRTTAVDVGITESTKTRGNKSAPVIRSETEEKQPRGRGKKIETQESVQSEPTTSGRGRRTKPVEEPLPETRGRKVRFEIKSEEIETNRRGRRAETRTSALSEPVARTRRNRPDETVTAEPKGRKRKAAAAEEIPSKVAKPEPKRGKRAETSVTETKQKRGVKRDSKAEVEKQEVVKSARGMRSKIADDVKNSVVVETKPARGRKVPEQKVAEAARGKRKAVVEPSPAKVAAKKRVKKASAAAPPSPAARTRPPRGKPAAEVSVATKAVGRSRRR